MAELDRIFKLFFPPYFEISTIDNVTKVNYFLNVDVRGSADNFQDFMMRGDMS